MAKSGTAAAVTGPAAEKRLGAFIAKFSVSDQARIRAARRDMRRRLAGAFELVYDNYNFFVIGYGPTERPSDAILSLAAQANRLALCFLQGARLPDPAGILKGSGRQVRSVRLESASDLQRPEIAHLIKLAVERAAAPLPAGRTKLVIRSVSAKQRPRRKPAPEGRPGVGGGGTLADHHAYE